MGARFRLVKCSELCPCSRQRRVVRFNRGSQRINRTLRIASRGSRNLSLKLDNLRRLRVDLCLHRTNQGALSIDVGYCPYLSPCVLS